MWKRGRVRVEGLGFAMYGLGVRVKSGSRRAALLGIHGLNY